MKNIFAPLKCTRGDFLSGAIVHFNNEHSIFNGAYLKPYSGRIVYERAKRSFPYRVYASGRLVARHKTFRDMTDYFALLREEKGLTVTDIAD
jgi:hypothetical protein